jgi:hypothetical protein
MEKQEINIDEIVDEWYKDAEILDIGDEEND